MGRGLSQLQQAIIEALAEYPAFEDLPRGQAYGVEVIHIGDLPRLSDILDALGRPRDNANRAAISQSLKRLCDRGLVTAISGQVAGQGRGYRYAIMKGVQLVA